MATNRFARQRSALVSSVFVVAASLSAAVFADEPGQVVVGNARFTVVTPNCVRVEYAADAKFVDDPSLFAADRKARATDVSVTKQGQSTVIATSAVTLTYTPDGRPFSPQNLSAEIKLAGGATARWTPGAANPGNLGGTARTLDNWDGAGDLGQGLLSRDGWYCLDDSKSPLFTKDWIRARPADAGTDWYLFAYGNDYKAALKSMTAVGGAVPLPRKYVLGTWYSRYWPYSSSDFRDIVKQYADHDFPLDMIVLDMDWHREGWTGFSWNRELLPDAEQLLKWFHEQGLHVTLNDHPADGIAPHEDAYPAFMKAMGEDPASKKTIDFDAGSLNYLKPFYDLTHANLEKDGVDFWWLDWQQYPNTRSIPSLTNLFALNHYYYDRSSEGGKRGQIFSRWGGWGSHRYPIQFSGDAATTFKMLAFEVPFTSTAGNVGSFFWSHDIGGHHFGRNEESYARWCQFGATTTALRSHSTRDPELDRRPWTYPKWVEDSIRKSFHLRSELMPYIYTSVQQISSQTLPLNRAMYVEYPNEERAYHSSQQYLFGDNLLVAPIAMPGVGENRVGWQVVWFPPNDTWFNFFSGERYDGGTEQLVAGDINEFPMFVRGGVPLTLRPYTQRMTTAPLDTLVVRCYPGTEGKTGSYTLYEDDGVTNDYQKGAKATTALSYVYANGQATVTIAPTEGKYDGQLEDRAYVIELPNTAKATAITIDGAAADASAISYDAEKFLNTVKVPARSIRKGCTIAVTTTPAGDDALAFKARLARGGVTATGQAPDAKALPTELGKLLGGMPAQQDRTPLLASFGVGLFEKNETTYRWPEQGILGLYAPKGLIDNEQVSYRVGSQSVALGTHRDEKLGGLIPIKLPTAASALPETPSKAFRGEVTFSIGGTKTSIAGPSMPVNFTAVDQNVAPKASVTTSSQTDRSPGKGAVDGVVSGYPNARQSEWESHLQTTDAWLKLTWNEPQTIDRVWLFDRQNEVDQITKGELVFDDGTTVPFGELPNRADTAAEVKFPAHKTKSLTVKVLAVKDRTENAGLAEIVVLKAK